MYDAPLLLARIAAIATASALAACNAAEPRQSDDVVSRPTITSHYAWHPVKIGGGLYAKHVAVHPREPELMYTYGMVGSARRWSPQRGEWVQIMTADSMPDITSYANHSVESLALDPWDPEAVLIAVKLSRDLVSVYRSEDRGATFIRSDLAVQPQGGHDVSSGERLVVDPQCGAIVYYGSACQGLWRSGDGGRHWQHVPSSALSPSADVVVVVFDPSSATTNDGAATLYAGLDKGGVLRSADGGGTWQQTAGAPGGPAIELTPEHMIVDIRGRLWVTYAGNSIWRRDAEGRWRDISPGGPLRYKGIAIDPRNPERAWTAADGPGPIFRTDDAGISWTQLAQVCVAPDNRWAEQVTSESNWRSFGELATDPRVPGRLYIAEGIGVWRVDNACDSTLVFSNMSAGLEDQNAFDVCAAPGGVLLTCVDDWTGYCHQDGPATAPDQRLSHGKLYLGTSVDYCPGVTGFVVKVANNKQGPVMYDNDSGYSTDGGRTWTVFEGVRKGTPLHTKLQYGTIAVAATDPDNIVWLPTTYLLPHYTLDRGRTWREALLPGVTNGGHIHTWIHKDALAADRVTPATFYLYHWGARELWGRDGGLLFRTSDGGRSWTNVCSTLPPGLWHPKLVAAPGMAGHLWFAAGKAGGKEGCPGLLRSRNGGATWLPAGEFDEPAAIAFGKAAPEHVYPAIYVAGTKAGTNGVWRSIDEGATWDRIAGYPCGIYSSVNCMDADKDVFGRVYMGFTGNSFVYGEIAEQAVDPRQSRSHTGVQTPASERGSGL